MSRRPLTAISAGAAALAVTAIGAGAYILSSGDSPSPGTGDVIAYSCKERNNHA